MSMKGQDAPLPTRYSVVPDDSTVRLSPCTYGACQDLVWELSGQTGTGSRVESRARSPDGRAKSTFAGGVQAYISVHSACRASASTASTECNSFSTETALGTFTRDVPKTGSLLGL